MRQLHKNYTVGYKSNETTTQKHIQWGTHQMQQLHQNYTVRYKSNATATQKLHSGVQIKCEKYTKTTQQGTNQMQQLHKNNNHMSRFNGVSQLYKKNIKQNCASCFQIKTNFSHLTASQGSLVAERSIN